MVQPRVVGLLVLTLMPALAGAEKLVPLAPEMKPPSSKELRERFHEAAARGAGGGTDVELVPTNEVRKLLSGLPALADCTGGPCIGNVATTMHAGQVLVTHIDQAGRRYVVQAVVFDATGKEIGKAEERCDICTVREADETVTKAARKAVASIVVVVAAVAVPPTAPVKTTPPPEEPGGPEAPRDPGKEPPPATTTPPRTTTPVPDAATAAKPASDTGAAPSKVPFRPLAIASFGVAGASLIGAISFFAFVPRDGKPTCGPNVPTVNCPTVYQGNGAGAGAFTVLTLVAAAAGGVLLYFDLKGRKKAPVVTLLPTADGVAGSASFEF